MRLLGRLMGGCHSSGRLKWAEIYEANLTVHPLVLSLLQEMC